MTLASQLRKGGETNVGSLRYAVYYFFCSKFFSLPTVENNA